MIFRLVGPNKQKRIEVTHIECFDEKGNLTILPEHEPELFLLKPHSFITLYTPAGNKEKIKIEQAILDIKRQEVTCLILL